MAILYPYGAADLVTLTATGAQAITINNTMTVIDGVTTQATGNRTLNITVNSELAAKSGMSIFLKSKTAGTETTIFGTGIDGATITGEAGKTFTQKFTYDAGSATFLPDGDATKID